MTAPVVVTRAMPDFSKLGRLRGAGSPIYEAVITATGDVETVRSIRSTSPELDAIVLPAIEQWKFEPAMRDGVAVPVYFTVTIHIDWQ